MTLTYFLTGVLDSKLFKSLVLVAVLAFGAYLAVGDTQPTKSPLTLVQAIQLLKQADDAEAKRDWATLVKDVELIVSEDSLPDEIRGSAFMLLGEYGFANNHLDIALKSYLIVRILPGATSEDKQDAETAINMIHERTGNNNEPHMRLPRSNISQL